MRDKADKRLWTLSIVGCVIVVLTVLFVSVKIETNNTKKRIHSTMEYIKDQYSMYNSFNEAVEARSLVRMVEKVQQTARNFKTDKQALEKEYLKQYAREQRLTGIIVLNDKNKQIAQYHTGPKFKKVSKSSEKNKWKLTDSLKEKIVELAKKDAQDNVYMGNAFMNLRKMEVSKVAPNRAALIGKFNQSMNSGNMSAMKEVEKADKKWLCILFGIPYEAEFQGEGTGSAAHVYNECGEEVLTYTEGVGWQEKETKAESQVHSALKSTYYEAFCDARKALNSEQRTGGI